MFIIALFLLACLIAGVTMWGMYRLRRGVLLAYVAGLARRGLPLEPALEAVSDRTEDAAIGSRLAGRLAELLEQGWSTPAAMGELRLLSGGEVAALETAQQSGTAAGLLDVLAQRATHFDRKLLRLLPMIIYPLAIGLVMLSVLGFITIFILPKVQMMFREMDVPPAPVMTFLFEWRMLFFLPIAGLLLWGLFLSTTFVYPIGVRFWWRIPVIGRYFRVREQARLARNLGFLLQSGLTLERALAITDRVAAGGRFRSELSSVADLLTEGVSVREAFALSRRWRPEVLWALESVSRGAPPVTTFETVAVVLEDKAEGNLNALTQAGTPLIILFSALSVGALGYGVFATFEAIQQFML